MNYPGLRYLLEKVTNESALMKFFVGFFKHAFFSSLHYLLQYGDQGFTFVAAPCNQFGGQAPGTSEDERAAAYRKFGTEEFPVLDKLLVNGPNAHPLYKLLKEHQPTPLPASQAPRIGSEPGAITWNYEKFLCDRRGIPVKRYKPAFDPIDFEGDVKLLLAGRPPLPAECIAHPGRKVCNVDKILSQD